MDSFSFSSPNVQCGISGMGYTFLFASWCFSTKEEKQMEELCEDLYAHIPGTKFGDLIKMLPSNCDKKFCAKVFQGLLKVEKQQAFLSVRKK